MPINFRLSRRRGRATSSSTAAPGAATSIPSSTRRCRGSRPSTATSSVEDDELYLLRHRAARLGAGRERHGDHQLHVRDDGPAQGRADHAPQHLDQRGHVRPARRRHRPRRLPAHAADVPRQRLGHAVRDGRHGRAAGRAAQGRRRRDPAPRREARRHADVRCAAVVAAVLDAAGDVGRRDPRARPGPHHRRGRAAADPDDRAGRGRARLGVRPDLRPDRDVAAAHHQPCPRPSGTTSTRTSAPHKLVRAGAPALGVRLQVDEEGEVLARSNVVLEGYWDQPEETAEALRGRVVPHRRRRRHRRRGLRHDRRPAQGRDHHRRRERLVDRGRGRDLLPPGRRGGGRHRRTRRQVGRDDQGAGRARPTGRTRPRPS